MSLSHTHLEMKMTGCGKEAAIAAGSMLFVDGERSNRGLNAHI